MCYANGNALYLQFFGIDIRIAFLILVAGTEKVCFLFRIKSEHFEIIHALIECHDDVTDVCAILFTDYNVVPGMNTGIHHGFAFSDQRKELALANKRLRHTDVLYHFFGFFLTFAAGKTLKAKLNNK